MSPKKLITKERKSPYKTPHHQWTCDLLFEEFHKESDRAAVILVASIIDESLTNLLKSFFVSSANSDDSLFDHPTSPLANFNSKIDICYRLWIISNKLTQDIHTIRKIRNVFAHDIYWCSFESWSVKSKVWILYKNLITVDWMEDHSWTRKQFLICSSAILWCINTLSKEIKCLEWRESEWLYEKSS